MTQQNVEIGGKKERPVINKNIYTNWGKQYKRRNNKINRRKWN